LLDRLQQSYNFRAEPLHLAIEGLCGYCAEHGAGESVGADAG
jgi:hypothetical protein